jgi:hypothetical protein
MKAGSRIYKSQEVPINAVINTNKIGREFYISGICYNTALIRYIDSGEVLEIKLGLLKNYL